MIDLKAAYGRTYRITLDESATIDGQTREDRLWLYQIPCKYGHIHVHGTNTLGGYTNRRKLHARLEAIPGAKVHQRGDSELTVTFAPEVLPAVADLLQARKRRHVTPEQAQAGAERLANWREEHDMDSEAKPRGTSGPAGEPRSQN